LLDSFPGIGNDFLQDLCLMAQKALETGFVWMRGAGNSMVGYIRLWFGIVLG
jgi:hypothetical protein